MVLSCVLAGLLESYAFFTGNEDTESYNVTSELVVLISFSSVQLI